MTPPVRPETEALRIDHVLVPLDGSPFAAGAMPTARALAARLGAQLQVVSAAPHAEDLNELRAHAISLLGGDAGADAHADADERARMVVHEDPATVIERRAAELDPCLVCISTHGRGRVAGAALGSVAASLLQRSTNPIVAVGPAADRPQPFSSAQAAPKEPRLVACVDGGEPSERIIPVAAAWAEALGMSLTILTVAEPTPPPLRAEGTWHRHHGPEEDVDAYLDRLRARWAEALPSFDAQVVYDPLGPGDGLRTHLDEQPAGMVAVTTHARLGLQRVLLGSGAAEIIHAARVPVLVVPLGA